MSLPKRDQAKSGYDTAMGQRMAHFSEYSGRVDEIFLLEDRPTELGANISIADAEWAEQEARKTIAALRERESSVEIEIRWCPAHQGIPGNKVADGWYKQAG